MPQALAPPGSYSRTQQDAQRQSNLDANQLLMLRTRLQQDVNPVAILQGRGGQLPGEIADLTAKSTALSAKIKQQQDAKTAADAGLTMPDLADVLMQGGAAAQRRKLLSQGAGGSFLTGPSGSMANASTLLTGGF